MLPLKKSDQARINGAKSRGAITEEGKRRFSMNDLNSGNYAKNVAMLSTELRSGSVDHLASNILCMQPACERTFRTPTNCVSGIPQTRHLSSPFPSIA